MKTLNDHIEITPNVRFGKPRIAGRRITVSDIAVWHERLGMSVDEICEGYSLTRSEVHAALAYYFDHQPEIDAEIARSEHLAEKLRQELPSTLRDKLRKEGNGG